MTEIWSSSVLSRRLSTYPAHASPPPPPPPPPFRFSEGRNKSASGYLRLESCISQTPSSDIISNISLYAFIHSLSVPLPSNFSPFPCQIFEGNSNYDTPELRTVEPLLTRFIRIYPERATPAGMGLRLELLGCEIEGKLEPQLELLLKSIALSVFDLNYHLSFGAKYAKVSSD